MEDVHVIVERVRSATVMVTTGPPGAGRPVGSGFFVAPGCVLTCAHVVEQAGLTPHVWWFGRWAAATVQAATPPPAEGTERVGDVAVLRIADTDNAWVPLGPAATAGVDDRVWAYGVTDLRRGDQRPPELDGSVGRVTLTAAPPGAVAGNPYVAVTCQISGGMSGGPLLNLNTFGVCGMVQSRQTGAATGGWAVPIDAALSVGGLEALLDHDPADAAGLESLRSSQLGFGGLPALVAARLNGPAVDVLERYLANPPRNRVRPPVPTDQHRKEWMARQLFTLSLAQLVAAVDQVIGELGVTSARLVFQTVAPCLAVGVEPPWWWIAGDATASLRAELDLAQPRLVHVASDREPSIKLLLQRAYEEKVDLERCGGAPSAEVGADGLDRYVNEDIRSALLSHVGARNDEWPSVGAGIADVLRETNTFLQLDLGEAPDLARLRTIVDLYPGVRFLICSPKITPPAGADDVLLLLHPPVDPNNERRALAMLGDFEQRLAAAT